MVFERAKTLLPQRWLDSARECLDWVGRLRFRPYVRELEVEGERARFLVGDPTAEAWYVRHPAGAHAQLRWLRERMVSPGDVVFEGGSHHGFFAVFLSRYLGEGGLFVCLEAHPRNAEIIRSNLRLNQLSNVRVMNCLVGGERGWGRVLNTSNARFLARADAPGGWLTVPVATLDQIAEEMGHRPTLLKLDIEGLEVAALEAAEGILAARPKLSLEIHCAALRARHRLSPDRILSLLSLAHYDLWLQSDEVSPPWRVQLPFSLESYDRVHLHGLPR